MSSRLRLGGEEYHALQRRVLEREGWRGQGCGRREPLEVHHLERRSRGGADREANLITLCAGCHRQVHQGGEL